MTEMSIVSKRHVNIPVTCCAVDALGRVMAFLDHLGFLALEGTEVAMIVFACVPSSLAHLQP